MTTTQQLSPPAWAPRRKHQLPYAQGRTENNPMRRHRRQQQQQHASSAQQLGERVDDTRGSSSSSSSNSAPDRCTRKENGKKEPGDSSDVAGVEDPEASYTLSWRFFYK